MEFSFNSARGGAKCDTVKTIEGSSGKVMFICLPPRPRRVQAVRWSIGN